MIKAKQKISYTNNVYRKKLSENLFLEVIYKIDVENYNLDLENLNSKRTFLLDTSLYGNLIDTTGSTEDNHLCDMIVGKDQYLDFVDIINPTNVNFIGFPYGDYDDADSNFNPVNPFVQSTGFTNRQHEAVDLFNLYFPFPFGLDSQDLDRTRELPWLQSFDYFINQGQDQTSYVLSGWQPNLFVNMVYQDLRIEQCKPIPYGVFTDSNYDNVACPFERFTLALDNLPFTDISNEQGASLVRGISVLNKYYKSDVPIGEPVDRVWTISNQTDYYRLNGEGSCKDIIDTVKLITIDSETNVESDIVFEPSCLPTKLDDGGNRVLDLPDERLAYDTSSIPLASFYPKPNFVPTVLKTSWRQDLLEDVFPNSILTNDKDVRWSNLSSIPQEREFYGTINDRGQGLPGASRFCHYWDKMKVGTDHAYWYREDKTITYHWGDTNVPLVFPSTLYYDTIINNKPFRQQVSISYVEGTVTQAETTSRVFECNLNQSLEIPWLDNHATIFSGETENETGFGISYSARPQFNAYDLNSKLTGSSSNVEPTCYNMVYKDWDEVLIDTDSSAFFDGLPYVDGQSCYEWIITESEQGDEPRYEVNDVGNPIPLKYSGSITGFNPNLLYNLDNLSGFIISQNSLVAEETVSIDEETTTTEYVIPFGNAFRHESPLIASAFQTNGLLTNSLPSWAVIDAEVNYVYIDEDNNSQVGVTSIASISDSNGSFLVGLTGVFPPNGVQLSKIYEELQPNSPEEKMNLQFARLRVDGDKIKLYEDYSEVDFPRFSTLVTSNYYSRLFNSKKFQFWKTEE